MPTPLMRGNAIWLLFSVSLLPLVSGQDSPATDAEMLVGPATEKRFPPLTVPDGFKATLFACDPLIEYPSVISIGPRAGTLFVAHDYVTGLGVEIVRRDEVRLIEDTDDDGYADRSIVFAKDFNSIQGLAYYDETVFVMHAPLLTSLRDTDGDGTADERRDLIAGLGLPPEENSNRLHCANGVTAGHDGWLYLSLGDRGCDVKRPEGDRLLFQQGGILRCRTDGANLHVFSTGLRNIYDVALDAELNVFVRDNENDGGDYMIRVNHCFFGSDHGYPYHYYERPDEPMLPLADLGRGSSAGGTSYLETAFPSKFRESLFFCEWGRAVVRYRQSRAGSSFQPMTEFDFAAGASDDPYGFKPTDVVVDYDGSLLISDWADGQRPKRGRGRIYRITYAAETASTAPRKEQADGAIGGLSNQDLAQQLNSPGYQQRLAAQLELERRVGTADGSFDAVLDVDNLTPVGQMHAVWIIAGSGSESALEELFRIAESDRDVRVRAQAIQAIGDLTDPVLVEGRLRSSSRNHKVAARVAKLLPEDAAPRLVLEALIVMRRVRWCKTPGWMGQHLHLDEPALNHAAAQALRHCRNWRGVAGLLDGPARLRRLALHAMAEQRVEYLANELIERLDKSDNPRHTREYADALSRIVRRLAPWTYWGFRPAPRTAATVDWQQTPAIIKALNARLADDEFEVRTFVLQRMLREGAAVELTRLAEWLRVESDEARMLAILSALDTQELKAAEPLLVETIARKTAPDAGRSKALDSLMTRAPDRGVSHLVQLANQLEDGPVLGAVLRELGERPKLDVDGLLLDKLESPRAIVRAAAIRALGKRGTEDARRHVTSLLADQDAGVRMAAALSAGPLGAEQAADSLLMLADGDDPSVVAASLRSLQQLRDDRAVTVAAQALEHSATQHAAMAYLRDFGNPTLLDNIVRTAATNLSSDYQREAALTLSAWHDRYTDARAETRDALAVVAGHSGQPFAWQVAGGSADENVGALQQLLAAGRSPPKDATTPTRYRIGAARGAEISLALVEQPDEANGWLAWTPVDIAEDTEIEILASATGELSVWVNGARVHQRSKAGPFRADSDRFPAQLSKGSNLVALHVRATDKAPRFHLRFRRRSSKAEHERLTQLALQGRGNPNRGREVFENVKKAACVNCHRLGQRGGRIGPDLSGIGRRFSRIHLIESILEPSRTVAPSYSTVAIVLNDGRIVTGVRTAETDDVLVIGDNQGKTHEIRKADIDEIVARKESTMPEGLDKTMTDREFIDLLWFLESQKGAE